jgi:hypothetical protein
MKLLIRNLSTFFLLPLIFAGCIKDDQPDCPEEMFTVTVTPDNVQLSYEAHSPASQKLTVTCLTMEGMPDDTYLWTLSMPSDADSWLQLTFDPAGLTGKGTSVSGTGTQFVYLVAQENTTAAKRVTELFIDNGETVAVTITQDFMPLQITPANITLSGVPHNPAVQTVSVSSNEPWTLTSSHPWLLLSLSATGSQASNTISSERTRTVYLVADGNSGKSRTAEIYLNNNSSDVRVTVMQESLIAEWGQSEPRVFIYETGGDRKLMLTKEPTNYGAYFQFGNVIGWNWGDVVASYNPTSNSNLSNWNSIWNNGNKDVVHSPTELLLGRGDPCRLVGYTMSEIRAALAAGRAPDNSHWRLPTNAENIVFGFGLSGSEWTTINGVPGRVFTSDGTMSGAFLPASGRIISQTASCGQKGSMGFYISSSLNNDSDTPYSLFFSQQTIDVSDHRDVQSQGFSVRCVRQ